MKEDWFYTFNPEKNKVLKCERGISFEEIISAIQSDSLLDIIEHSNQNKYPNQKVYIVNVNDYVYLVPFVEKEGSIFLKTIFPSRKLTKRYLRDN